MVHDPLRRKDAVSLAAYLPYDSFDPEGGVFVHRDASLGLAWSLGVTPSETASPAEMEALSARFAEFFRHLPAGAAAQFILACERDVREGLARFIMSAPPHPALGPLFEGRGELLRDLSFRHGGMPYAARTIRLYFTLRIFPDFGADEREIVESYPREKEKLLETAGAVENFFAQVDLPFRRLGAEEFLGLVYRLLNPARAKEAPPRAFRPEIPLRDQAVRSAARADYDEGTVALDGVVHKVLSMVEVPEKTRPGALTRPVPGEAGVLDLIPEAVFVWNLGILDDHEMRKRLEKRNAFAWQQLQNPRKKLDLVEIKKDAEGALGELLAGRRALSVRLHVLLSDPDERALGEKSSSVIAALDRAGLEMVEEDALALTIFLQALPGAYDPASDEGLKRARTMISTNLADLLPLWGACRGTPGPDLLLLNRRGEPITFSFFDSDVAPHGIVTGVSGSGKSFFTNYLVASALRRGGHVFIFDRGNSYRKICDLVGGRYVVFDPDRPMRINPCGPAGSLDRDRHLALADLVGEMCAQGGGGADLGRSERGLILRAVGSAFERKAGDEVFLSDIRESLLGEGRNAGGSLGKIAEELALGLEPFVGKGPYAGFFDGPNEVGFDNPLTVFELGEVALRKEVASVLVLALLKNIGDFSAAPERLRQAKYLVLDEAWTLLRTPMTARFVENALRTYRKLGAAAIMVTQQVSDFEGPAGQAIRANAPNRLFLMQTPETILAMEKLLDLGPEEKKAIASVETAKGLFSEVFVQTPATRGIARLVADPYFYWLATSDPRDNARLAELAAGARARGEERPLLWAIREAATASRKAA